MKIFTSYKTQKFSTLTRFCGALMKTPFQVSTLLFLFLAMLTSSELMSQNQKVAQEIQNRQHEFTGIAAVDLLLPVHELNVRTQNIESTLLDAAFFLPNEAAIGELIRENPSVLRTDLRTADGALVRLQLVKAKAVTESFRVVLASNPDVAFPYNPGLFYWGIVEGMEHSLAAIAVTEHEVMGFFQTSDGLFTLGRMDGQSQPLHILYATADLQVIPDFACHTNDDEHYIGHDEEGQLRQSGGNCVRMYVEVDHDIVVGKGGVQQATDYVLGAFSQVAIMYANEDIDLVVSEILVWDVSDPYTGPNTSNYLTQFRNHLNGNYNGDLAHLVGYAGGGGIAYLDVLCNSFFGVGYSAINASYNNVPTYSWTIMVLTHEIGHNLGSHHTHACVWNGNNTAIDGCGPAAGYSEGCNGPLPANGTVMSYCHLIGGVGIDLNLGFGPQPGDLIRNRVNNAACLSSCGSTNWNDAGITDILEPGDQPCENEVLPIVRLQNFGDNTLSAAIIHYQLDNEPASSINWTGSLTSGASEDVTLPAITFAEGTHTFTAWTSLPNGMPDEDPSNDEATTQFVFIENYCDCFEATAQLSPNPLTHSGGGSSSASLSLLPDSKHVSFVIGGLTSKSNGAPQTRFNDQVTISYTDGNGDQHTFGTFLGSQQSSVTVYIDGFVQAVQVNLSNALNNNYNGAQSVSFSEVEYCSAEEPCQDSDGDGVCDEDDICPGFDDNLIGTSCDDGDPCTFDDVYTEACLCEGTPDPNCEEIECNEVITTLFPTNPLTHSGGGSSSTTAVFPPQNANVSFVISNLGAKLNGNPNQRYDDHVTVTYVDGAGNVQVYGEYFGNQVSTVNVDIEGYVQSVTVALANTQNNNVSVSVSMSPVTSCLPEAEPIWHSLSERASADFQLYPNPTTGDLFIRFSEIPEQADVRVFNTQGVMLGHFRIAGETQLFINLRQYPIHSHWLFLSVQTGSNTPEIRSVFLAD